MQMPASAKLASVSARFRLDDLEAGEPPVEFGLREWHQRAA
jgi:hypothetical protein